MIRKIGLCISIVLMVAVLSAMAYAVYLILSDGGVQSMLKPEEQAEAASESVGEPTEQVNEPLPENIVTMPKNSGYYNAHDFIAQTHKFYNETVCWGRLYEAPYSEQKQMAQKIVKTIDGMKSKNESLAKDLKNAQEAAEVVTKRDDRDTLITLHRFFHDLDIYFNGYDYSQTWGVTTFKG